MDEYQRAMLNMFAAMAGQLATLTTEFASLKATMTEEDPHDLYMDMVRRSAESAEAILKNMKNEFPGL